MDLPTPSRLPAVCVCLCVLQTCGDMMISIQAFQGCHDVCSACVLPAGLVQGAKGVYTCPIIMFCFGRPQARASVVSRLRNGGIYLANVDSMDPTGEAGVQASMAAMSVSEFDNSIDRMFDGERARAPDPPLSPAG